jgi:hypothetical protein
LLDRLVGGANEVKEMMAKLWPQLGRQGMRWWVCTSATELAVLGPQLQRAQREGKGENGEGEAGCGVVEVLRSAMA